MLSLQSMLVNTNSMIFILHLKSGRMNERPFTQLHCEKWNLSNQKISLIGHYIYNLERLGQFIHK